MNYDVISIGAHPDDVEVGSGGVLIKLADEGRKTGIIYLTAGELGTGGDVKTRQREAQCAAETMGADLLKTYDWGDTALADSYDKRLKLASDIRRYKPKIILCPAPWIGHGRRQSHADHVACGEITINASNLAGLKKAAIDGEPHQVSRIFYYFLPPGMMPDFIVDISVQFDRWIDALKCHESQFLNPEKSRDYIWTLESMGRTFGMMAGVTYGQGFKADQTLLVQDIFDLAKGGRF
ncbi:MAG: bacillithiol biosynthesis deacetylase BshB1 [candidate division Zixibacteria bacterium]|nr:bacillithiol biosynthesis deacetylase BshB1 [candidate division Zixibacteria bacterium]